MYTWLIGNQRSWAGFVFIQKYFFIDKNEIKKNNVKYLKSTEMCKDILHDSLRKESNKENLYIFGNNGHSHVKPY